MAKKNKHNLVEGPIGKTLFYMTLPMIMGQLSLVIFNLVDTFFVGRLGADQLAAMSFTFPVILMVGSISMGLGVGISVVVSRAIGEGNHDKIKEMTMDSMLLAAIVVVIVCFLGVITINPLFRFLGASDEMIKLIRSYMLIWYPGVLVVIIPMFGGNIIAAMGDTKTVGKMMLCAAIINVILDPLLIFGIGFFP